jgi:holo-ACP synthase
MSGTAEVTLEQVLHNRERRVLRQRATIKAFGCPLLSITLVNPGPVKDSASAREVMACALQAVGCLMAEQRWPVVHREVHFSSTGPEALFAVDASPNALKIATTRLEDVHPLGRLWDIDVIDMLGVACSRSTVGRPPRRCLLCDDVAHVCVRSRAHPLKRILQAVEEIVDAEVPMMELVKEPVAVVGLEASVSTEVAAPFAHDASVAGESWP